MTMQSYKFDDRNITWRTFDFLGSAYFVYDVNEQNGTVDALIKFPPNRQFKFRSIPRSFPAAMCWPV